MSPAKLQFSSKELELAANTDWILTKNQIVRKVIDHFAEIAGLYQSAVARSPTRFPEKILTLPYKISKGENYLGLPWVMLDYPRLFEKENIFAIRTLFWWGNFFSITLHLSGSWKKVLESSIIRNLDILRQNYFSLSINPDPWVHHFSENNYCYLPDTDNRNAIEVIKSLSHIKLARNYPVRQPEALREGLEKEFKLLLKICEEINYPAGEKDL